MTPMHFRGQHRVLEAPAGYDHRSSPVGEIVGLPVRLLIAYPNEGASVHIGFRSVWKPNAEELAALLAGGGIMVDIMGAAQPPIALGVCHSEEVLVEA